MNRSEFCQSRRRLWKDFLAHRPYLLQPEHAEDRAKLRAYWNEKTQKRIEQLYPNPK